MIYKKTGNKWSELDAFFTVGALVKRNSLELSVTPGSIFGMNESEIV